jgi:signal transduction histidine kinase
MEVDKKEIAAWRAGAAIDELRPKLMEGKALLDHSSTILERIRDDTGRILDAEQRTHEVSTRESMFVVIAGDVVLLALILAAAAVAVRDAADKARAIHFQQRVLGMVGHDLRNPLSVVTMSATQLANSSDLGDKRHATAARIVAAASRMDRMIRDLLDYSRIELRLVLPLDIRPAEVDASCARSSRISRVNPRVKLTTSREALAGRWDADRMEQVLENLLGNAIKYSPPETPVRFCWRKDHDAIVLEVRNQGAPIAPDLLPYVFEPFRRGTGHDARTSKSSLGLGLYIVRHIVAQHGGSIEVSSTEIEGTVFTVKLPQVASTSAHAAA